MTPKFDDIRRVLVASEDVLGPMTNSLYVNLADGTSISIDKQSEIRRLVTEIARFRPDIASAIEERLSLIPEFSCEQCFDLGDVP